MELTLFKNARNTAPSNLQESWAWLCETLPEFLHQERKRSDKLLHDAAIFGRCHGSRSNANVEFLSGLAADFDIGPDNPRYLDFNQMCDRLDREGFAYVAYTTTANDGPHNKFRLFMPYARDVDNAFCQAAWHVCNDKFDGAIDKSTKDPARLSFLPATWVENPYQDGSKGLVKLSDPFNAVRVNRVGKPILSDAEIDALPLSPVSGVSNGSATPAARTTSAATSAGALTPAERSALARRHSEDSPCWRLLSDFDRSPLVTDWMRNPPQYADDRLFKFLGRLARRAVRKELPINVECMVTLAEQFCGRCLQRPLPAEAARRADDALAFAFRNAAQAAPRQPDC